MTARCRRSSLASARDTSPSMEGRSRDRPMAQQKIGDLIDDLPSMEGRSRDRPMPGRGLWPLAGA